MQSDQGLVCSMIECAQRCEPTRPHTQCPGCARASAPGHAIDASGIVTAKMGCPVFIDKRVLQLFKLLPTAR
jgi:hypothetical protein